MGNTETATMQPYYYDLSQGYLLAHAPDLRSRDVPRHLTELHTIGRLVVGKAALVALKSATDVVPLDSILRDTERAIPPRTYAALDTAGWTLEDYEAYGRWIGGLPREPHQAELDRFMLIQASRLGIGPGVEQIKYRYKRKLCVFYDAIQLTKVRRNRAYDDWTPDDHLAHLLAIHESGDYDTLKDGITERKFQGEGPSYNTLRDTGPDSASRLLETAGVYTKQSIAAWSEQDYIDWGVRYMLANGGRELDSDGIPYLSKRMRGPSTKPIYRVFRSLEGYREQVRPEYHKRVVQLTQDVSSLQQRLHNAPIVSNALAQPFHHNVLFRLAAQYRLVQALGLNVSDERRQLIATVVSRPQFVATVLKHSFDMSNEKDIRAMARSMGIYEDIWPTNDYMTHMRVPKRAIGIRDYRNRSGSRRPKATFDSREPALPPHPSKVAPDASNSMS